MAKNGTPARGHNSGMVWLTRTVNSIDRDPEMDKFNSLLRKERLKDSDIAALAGLATSTVVNLRGGKTCRPQHTTYAKLAGAIGYSYELTREKTPDYTKEIPKAREQRRAYFNMRKQKTAKS